jgi:hypothetical protein
MTSFLTKKIRPGIRLIHFFFVKSKRERKNYCYHKACVLYDFFKSLDGAADYRINIAIDVTGRGWGHAWLTRNDRPFPRGRTVPLRLEAVGSNARYRYWIAR